MSQQQCTIALALIRDAEGRIFFQKRNDPMYPKADGRWDFPGGQVDFGETPEATIRRECREEIGCDVEVLQMIPWVRSHVWQRTDGVTLHVLALWYECRIVHGTPLSKTDETLEIRWATRDEARVLDTLPGIQECMDRAGL